MEEKRNINAKKAGLGIAVIVLCDILSMIFLAKILSFIGWFGFGPGWFRNPACWGFVIALAITFSIYYIYMKIVGFDDCRLFEEPTKISIVFHVIKIVLNIITAIVVIVQVCRIWYWGGFSVAILLAFVPACKICIASSIFKMAYYVFGEDDKDFHLE